MRRTLALTSAALILALCACLLSTSFLDDTAERMRYLHSEAVRAVEAGDAARAKEIMVETATLWREKEPILEMIACHDAIHEIKLGIIEAQICLECGDHDDFLRTMAIAGEGLDHMRSVEALSLSNLY